MAQKNISVQSLEEYSEFLLGLGLDEETVRLRLIDEGYISSPAIRSSEEKFEDSFGRPPEIQPLDTGLGAKVSGFASGVKGGVKKLTGGYLSLLGLPGELIRGTGPRRAPDSLVAGFQKATDLGESLHESGELDIQRGQNALESDFNILGQDAVELAGLAGQVADVGLSVGVGKLIQTGVRAVTRTAVKKVAKEAGIELTEESTKELVRQARVAARRARTTPLSTQLTEGSLPSELAESKLLNQALDEDEILQRLEATVGGKWKPSYDEAVTNQFEEIAEKEIFERAKKKAERFAEFRAKKKLAREEAEELGALAKEEAAEAVSGISGSDLKGLTIGKFAEQRIKKIEKRIKTLEKKSRRAKGRTKGKLRSDIKKLTNLKDNLARSLDDTRPVKIKTSRTAADFGEPAVGDLKSDFWHFVVDRALRPTGDQLRGGTVGALSEGSLRTAIRQFEKDSPIREFLGTTLPKLYETSEATKVADMFAATELRRLISAQIQKVVKTSNKTFEELGEELLLARANRNLDMISDPELRELAEEAGAFIDGLSAKFVASGRLTSDQVQTVVANFGEYMHLHYAKHNVKGWIARVEGTADWDMAFDHLVRKHPELSEEEILGAMTHMAMEEATGKKLRQHFVGRLPREVMDEFKPRDLDPELRGLFGVSRDFPLTFDKTTAIMIHDLEAGQFIDSVLEQGKAAGLFTAKPRRSPGTIGSQKTRFDRALNTLGFRQRGFTVRLPTDITRGEELWTTKEVATALGKLDSVLKDPTNFLQMANGLTKFGKTALSIGTQLRNAYSILGMLTHSASVGSALVSPKAAYEAGKLTARLWRTKALPGSLRRRALTESEFALIKEAHELGLISTGALSGQAKEWAAQVANWYTLGEKLPRVRAAAGEALGSPAQTLMSAYGATDDAGKFFAWQMHIRRLEALVKTDEDIIWLKELTGTTDIREAAAEIVKNTMQHFPRTAPIGKKLARNPFVGTFTSFPLEITRNISWSARYAALELRHAQKIAPTDPKGAARFLAAGAERLAGIVASVQVGKATANLLARVWNVTTDKLIALRELSLFEYDQNADIVVTDRDGYTVTYFNAGHSFPADAIAQFINSVWAKPVDADGLEGLPERIENGLAELEEVFLSREIFLGGALEAIKNERLPQTLSEFFDWKEARGMQIAKPGSQDEYIDRLYHFIRTVSPGTVNQLDNLQASLSGKRFFGLGPDTPEGTEVSFTSELAALFGLPRFVTIDIPQHARVKTFEIGTARANLMSAAKEDMDASISRAERQDVLDFYEPRWGELQNMLRALIRNGMAWDVPATVMIDSMSDSTKVPKDLLLHLAYNDDNLLMSESFSPPESTWIP